MTVKNLNETLEQKVNEAKANVQQKFFKEFLNTKSMEEREFLHAKLSVLDDIMFTLINTIRGNK